MRGRWWFRHRRGAAVREDGVFDAVRLVYTTMLVGVDRRKVVQGITD